MGVSHRNESAGTYLGSRDLPFDIPVPPGGIIPAVPGYTDHKDEIQVRLSRIEGQVRGIQRMVDEDRYCIDILTQVNAVKAAIDKVAINLLEDHVKHCVADAVKAGEGEEKLQELTTAVGRFLKG
jgi:CsoR family transcriptional regulator, copper-sensing transcriptional repressor